MKICSKCHLPKPESEFFKRNDLYKSGKSNKDRLRSACKSCTRKITKKWNEDNREKDSQNHSDWYKRNLNHVKQKHIKWRNKNYEYFKNYQIKWRRDNPDKCRKVSRMTTLRKYGLSLNQYNLMLKKQNYTCALCEKPFNNNSYDYPCVDHNHDTGKVRAILCRRCNSGLGHFFDDPFFLRRAIHYLENY